MARRRIFLPVAVGGVLAGLLLVAAGCSSQLSSQGDGPGPVSDAYVFPFDWWRPGLEGPPPPPPPPPPPNGLPTFVNMNWDAFPKDPGPNYPVTGKVWVVKTSGNDGNPGTEASPLRNISTAAQQAQSGDQIKVYGGSYNETDGVTLSQNNVVVTAASGETVTMSVPTSGFEVTAQSDVVINGININGCTRCIQLGLENSSQKNVVISNLTINCGSDDWADGIVAFYNTAGQGFATSDGVLIKNVTINDGDYSIGCGEGPCNSWRLENVKIKGRGSSGGWGADGAAFERGDNLLFYGVEVSQVDSDGIDCKASRVVVWNSHVHHVGNNGIKLWKGGDIVNTYINDLTDEASIVSDDGRVRLLHVTVANQNASQSYGMALGYDTTISFQAEIINSIYYNTWGAIYISGNATATVKNSLFFGTTNGGLLEWGSNSVSLQEGNAGIKQLGLGDNNLVVDPQLGGNYHLQAGSPAINKGTVLGSLYPSTDAAGQARVKNNLPDLGPFEDF